MYCLINAQNGILIDMISSSKNEIIDKVSNTATDSIREHKDYIMESTMSDAEIDYYIKKLIQEKLVGN